MSGPTSAPFYQDSTTFGALKRNAWHLIATGNAVEPSTFNVSDVSPTPPGTGVVPTNNFQTLWTWSASLQKWYFYATAIEANGYTTATGTLHTGLDAVRQAATDAGYLDFHNATPPKTLGSGAGFWVRR